MFAQFRPFLAVLGLPLALGAATFTGGDGDWFNAANWDPARLPEATTDARLPAGVRSRVSGGPDAKPAEVRDLDLGPGAELTLLPGAGLNFRHLTLTDATLLAREAALRGDRLELAGTEGATVWLNPTSNDSRAIKIAANNPAKHTLGFGLAGTTPASPGNTGSGFHATLKADTVELADRLAIQTFHGFTPAPGDSFRIIDVETTRTGTFDGLPEGAIVARYGTTDLVISYQGGDGNDVVLTAVASDKNRFTGRSTDWFDALNWSQRRLPSTHHDLFISATDVVLHPPKPGLTIALADVVLRDGASLTLRNATVTAATVDSEGSGIELISSHLACDVFIDPFTGGIKLNPSFLECDEFHLTKLEGIASFGIDGTTPAGPGALGSGHHSRVLTGSAFLDGNLEITFPYGFLAAPGQTYEIITVTQPNTSTTGLHGTFLNAAEGALVGRQGNLGFYLSYLGGNGNDVTLTTATLGAGDPNPLARYTGTDDNFLAPANWLPAGVPTASTDILLDDRSAVLEPTTPGDTLTVGQLTLRDGSTLTVRHAKLIAAAVDVENSVLDLVSSHLVILRGPFGGFSLNPSFLECDEFHLTKLDTTVTFGIDGTTPAGPGALGSGHHSRVQTGSAFLDGNLEITFPHGFLAAPGQTYEIITVTQPNTTTTGLHGTFRNAAEGALIARQGNLGFYLSYLGGNGNDVTLTTATLGAGDPNPLATFQGTTDGDFLTPTNWLPASVPTATTDILLDDRTATLEPNTPGDTLTVGSIRLRHGSTLVVRDAKLIADHIHSDGSWIELFSSHLVTGIFIDPFSSGIKFNPSFLECDEFHLTKLEGTVTFGIDGTIPTGPGALGSGHHSRVQTGSAFLDGNLEIDSPHGFTPQPGQTFEVLTVTAPQTPLTGLHGRFRNAREGDPVARVGDVALFLSYKGGDGNDVTLTAQPVGGAGATVARGDRRVHAGDDHAGGPDAGSGGGGRPARPVGRALHRARRWRRARPAAARRAESPGLLPRALRAGASLLARLNCRRERPRGHQRPDSPAGAAPSLRHDGDLPAWSRPGQDQRNAHVPPRGSSGPMNRAHAAFPLPATFCCICNKRLQQASVRPALKPLRGQGSTAFQERHSAFALTPPALSCCHPAG